MKKINLLLFAAFMLAFVACKEEDVPQPTTANTSTVNLNFDNVVGNRDLELDSGVYVNAFEQYFTIAKFNYFISNISFQKTDDTWYTLPADSSYFLVKEKDLFSHTLKLNGIPAAEYKAIRFMLGVDSLRNTMPLAQRAGMLDPTAYAADMYWTWNQGYIFMKLECWPYTAKGDTTNRIPYVYHIGGFGGMNTPTVNNLKWFQFDFTARTFTKSKTSNFMFTADALQVLVGPNNVDFEISPTVMLTPFSARIAENYSTMINLQAITEQ
jgi:hypothetical protein